MNDLIATIKEEFKSLEPNLTIAITSTETPLKIMDIVTQSAFLKVYLHCIKWGLQNESRHP